MTIRSIRTPGPRRRRVAPGPSTRRRMAALLLCALLAGCQTPGPDGPADSFGLDFRLPPDADVRGAIVFFVDGVNAGMFQRMLEANELPAIKAHFVDRGLYCPRAVASVPCSTLPNQTSFVTGRFPGHHGVVLNQWFDRRNLLYRNYETIAQKNTLDGDYWAPTVYEQLGDRLSFSLFFQAHRGAGEFVQNWTAGGVVFFFGAYQFLDRMTLNELRGVAAAARRQRRFPAVTVCYLLAPDFAGYRHGVDSPQYRHALLHTDRQIGRVLGDLRRADLLDRLVVALVSDHGLLEVRRHCRLRDLLERQFGLSVAGGQPWETTPLPRRLDIYEPHSAVVVVSGDRFAAVHLRRPRRSDGHAAGWQPWDQRPDEADLRSYPCGPRGERTADLPEALVAQPAVDAVAYRLGADRVRLHRKDGQVEFRQDAGPGGPISYHAVGGDDPLGWRGVVPPEALAGAPMDERSWLRATAETRFPDLPAQLLAYFRHARSADLAVFAAEDWDFNTVNRAGHGGLSPGEMHVPILLAGPGVPRGLLPAARLVDVMPTLLELLGRPAPDGLDGRSLLGRSAPD